MCMTAALTLVTYGVPSPALQKTNLKNLVPVNWPLAPAISRVEFLGL